MHEEQGLYGYYRRLEVGLFVLQLLKEMVQVEAQLDIVLNVLAYVFLQRIPDAALDVLDEFHQRVRNLAGRIPAQVDRNAWVDQVVVNRLHRHELYLLIINNCQTLTPFQINFRLLLLFFS